MLCFGRGVFFCHTCLLLFGVIAIILISMKNLLLACLLLPIVALAQDATFVVKKGKQAFKPGFYCSDYMTDGRICFYFDTTGNVRVFNSDKAPDKIRAAFAQNPRILYTAPYTVINDTVRFTAVLYLNPGDFNPITLKQSTTVTGLAKDDMIRLYSVTDVNGRVDSKKEIFVRRIEN